MREMWGGFHIWMKRMMLTVMGWMIFAYVYGQDGSAGIQKANEHVRGYFKDVTSLMYAIGAIVGLVGAIKVYQKWNAGDPDTSKVASAWFGSCVFLVVVTTVIKSFFGI